MKKTDANSQGKHVLLVAMMGGLRGTDDLYESLEPHDSRVTVDDIIRAAKTSGIELTDSDVVAIACAL